MQKVTLMQTLPMGKHISCLRYKHSNHLEEEEDIKYSGQGAFLE
jgi:hypothetical protein